ncbi:Uncharacterized protein TPAR_02253 [Tolypocladium paradoxum]|uniref:Zn(2)-C6 fungal-type domain-containing protein n=1 Tax=Tolypocladium paradoxum TaxID=94208 RepID=A0A2S4L562_9HYPO|nr:Uncharacterized protein TPAR_02253 [Tolypocladium paradoxum]
MGDYQHFLTSMSGAEGYPPANPDELNPSVVGPRISVRLHGTPIPGAYQNVGSLESFPDPVLLNASKQSKGRSKSGAGPGTGADHMKHRRTRSGCFMCRSRRVKCDETRPICERCKKGNRDCVFPDPPAPKGASSQSTWKDATSSGQKHSPKPSNCDDDEGDLEQEEKLETIHDEDETEEALSPPGGLMAQAPGTRSLAKAGARRPASRHSSESLSQEFTKRSSSPSTSTTGSASANTIQSYELEGHADWPPVHTKSQPYIDYFVENITNYHYGLASDGDGFFSNILTSMAARHEPLLYALVGFSAYHAMLQNPNGTLQDFLHYYNKSVTLLLGCLKRKETNNVPTLVTILQLATIEEFLGDWVNLMGHQKAALEIITQIFTPENVMNTAVGRMCLNWYSRYDNYVAIMGGFPTELPREWFNTMAEYTQAKVANNPGDLRWKIEDRSVRLRLITYDMSMLYARGSRGQISPEDFTCEHNRITQRLVEWKTTWDPALVDPRYLVTDFSYRKPIDPGDIVDPYKPGVLFKPPLFTTTLISAEWHSILIMHLTQSANTPPMQLFMELGKHAYAACQYFESVQLWPLKPKGSLISLHPCISIAALFLPQDLRHQMWIRRKFALLDILGCIHPTTRRMKMAEVFRDPSCAHWWLPNDEGLTPILQSIRTFADERNVAAVNAQQENIREIDETRLFRARRPESQLDTGSTIPALDTGAYRAASLCEEWDGSHGDWLSNQVGCGACTSRMYGFARVERRCLRSTEGDKFGDWLQTGSLGTRVDGRKEHKTARSCTILDEF